MLQISESFVIHNSSSNIITTGAWLYYYKPFHNGLPKKTKQIMYCNFLFYSNDHCSICTSVDVVYTLQEDQSIVTNKSFSYFKWTEVTIQWKYEASLLRIIQPCMFACIAMCSLVTILLHMTSYIIALCIAILVLDYGCVIYFDVLVYWLYKFWTQ